MQQGGETVREDGRTVREDGATVREDGRTVRESSASPSAAPAQDTQAPGWLPGDLAADYRVIESLPALGGEADLYVVEPLDAEDDTRRVAKVYREGMVPKEDVLRLVKQAEPAHVVRLEAYGQDDGAGRWWELMEYVERDSLRQFLDREGPKLSEDLIRDILRELNDALTDLHRLQLEHRDLKPDNVLVRSLTPLDLVMSDFGIASIVEGPMHFTGRMQTAMYAPPEALGSQAVVEHTKWDYWSLGMMLVEMLEKHPFKDVEDQAIGYRLVVEDVDDLTREISDPAWRMLCRGLLRRTPEARWNAEEVSKWLADPNDPGLRVAEEAPGSPPVAEPLPATIDFDGARYATPAELGAALAEDWGKAKSYWKRRYPDVRNWVTDELGLTPLGDALADIDDSGMPLDTQVFNFIYHLAPEAPLRFRDERLTMEGLAALCRRAAVQKDADARDTLLRLYRQGILVLAGSLPDGEPLAEAQRRWEDAVNDYERRRNEAGARVEAIPAPNEGTLVDLLAGSLPVPEVVDALRTRARRARTANARRCPWFARLGKPENMPVSALVLLPRLRSQAERVGRPLRMRPLYGCIGGVIAGGLLGLQVMWAHVMFVFDPQHYLFHPVATVLISVAVTFTFYGAFVWDIRGVAARRRRQSNTADATPRSGPIGRMIDRGGAGIGCLLLIAIPLAAIFALAFFVLLLVVTSIPSLVAMDAIGLIDFGLEHFRARRSMPLSLTAVSTPDGGMQTVFNPLFNATLYVAPHAILGALVGSFARRRWVIAASILVFLGLAAVVIISDPRYVGAMIG